VHQGPDLQTCRSKAQRESVMRYFVVTKAPSPGRANAVGEERPVVVAVVNRRVTNLSRHSQTTQEAPARPSLGLSLYVATLTASRGPL
jgi:hypothetical protein